MSLERFRVGNAVLSAATDIICLYAAVTATARYDTFKNGAGQYTITAAKNFYIFRIVAVGPTANTGGEIGQATATIADAAGPPAGYVALTTRAYLVNPVAYTLVKEEGIIIPVMRATGQFITYKSTEAAGTVIGCMIWGFEI